MMILYILLGLIALAFVPAFLFWVVTNILAFLHKAPMSKEQWENENLKR